MDQCRVEHCIEVGFAAFVRDVSGAEGADFLNEGRFLADAPVEEALGRGVVDGRCVVEGALAAMGVNVG